MRNAPPASKSLAPHQQIQQSAETLIQQPVEGVNEAQRLEMLCAHWHECASIAIDTEFMRTDTYYPIPALIQINDGEQTALIDPLAMDSMHSLRELMTDPSTEKVLHACSEDVEVFHRLLGVVPAPLFDTQIAAAFVGSGFSVGYANLTKTILGVELPKGETRSNWLRRPLSQAQCHYAALDVEYLWKLQIALKKQLSQLDRSAWVEEECGRLIREALTVQDPAQSILRFKAAWKLSDEAQTALFVLSRWREQEAQNNNRPRNHIVHEKVLYALAEQRPASLQALSSIPELSDKVIDRYGQTWLDLLQQSTPPPADTAGLLDLVNQKRPPQAKQKKQVSALRSVVADLAIKLDMAQEALARKKDYEHIVAELNRGRPFQQSLPQHFQSGWRQQVLVPALACLAETFG